MAPAQHFHLAIKVSVMSLMPLTSNLPSATPQHTGSEALFLLHPSLKYLNACSGELHDQGNTCTGSPALSYTGSTLLVSNDFQSSMLRSILGETFADCWCMVISTFPYKFLLLAQIPEKICNAPHTVCLLYESSPRQ